MMKERMINSDIAADWQWTAVSTRDRQFDGAFFFAVRTTGVFCRPSCASRTPRRENISFFPTVESAENSGFRACLKCRPKEAPKPSHAAELVSSAFRVLSSSGSEIGSVEELSGLLNVSAGYLQKTFKNLIGVSPKEVLDSARIKNFKPNVRKTDVVTALYESGFGSSRSLYEKAADRLGMTPAVYKKGGNGIEIRYSIADSPIGKLLVAATDRGICAVSFGDNDDELKRELETEFFDANIAEDTSVLSSAVDSILRGIDGERSILGLPLDVRGTAFQMRVWSELRKIPCGETRSYAQVARAIGTPKAVRAVARACATNPVALITPCHRVVASDGKLSGYRWGIERKARLLEIEKGD